MQLSELTGKPLRVGKTIRGVCVGVGISLKSRTAKYLLCSSQKPQQENIGGNGDFAVNIASVEGITDEEISLPRLRSVFPKNCAKIFIGKPVFSDDGVYLGKIEDVDLQNMIATQLTTNKNITYSALTLTACSDVVILRKELPFPIGQRIPAPLISTFLDENDVVVTKAILREAVQNGSLVRLTLSLPPFQMDDLFPKQKKRRFF